MKTPTFATLYPPTLAEHVMCKRKMRLQLDDSSLVYQKKQPLLKSLQHVLGQDWVIPVHLEGAVRLSAWDPVYSIGVLLFEGEPHALHLGTGWLTVFHLRQKGIPVQQTQLWYSVDFECQVQELSAPFKTKMGTADNFIRFALPVPPQGFLTEVHKMVTQSKDHNESPQLQIPLQCECCRMLAHCHC